MCLKAGWRWFEGGLYWCKDWKAEDLASGETKEDRTTRIILDSMNAPMEFLVFTKESANDFENRKLPTLDIEIWIDKLRIWYRFYQKPMSNNIVIQEKSALSEMVKSSSLTEEIFRRLKNTRRELPSTCRLETLEDLTQKMKNSGHKDHFMRRIMIQGIVKYERRVKKSELNKDDTQYIPLHQPSGRCMMRMKRKAQAQENWFRGADEEGKGKDEKPASRTFQKSGKREKTAKKIQPTTVMFVPSTRNGTLIKRLRENEEKLVEMTGFRMSYSESGGTQLGRIFSTNLASDQPCGRPADKCIPCTRNIKLQNCKARSIVYESSCEVCNPPEEEKKGSSRGEEQVQGVGTGDWVMADPSQGRVGIYIGESSRSLAERSLEHFNDAKAFSKKSHMVKHWMISHGDMETLPPFRIRILRQYQDCLSRQVGEAIQILLSNDHLLNSKNEYVQNCISRITVQEDQYERRARLLREDTEERRLENDMLEFKAKKKTDKRKPQENHHLFQGSSKRIKMEKTDSSHEEGSQVHGVTRDGTDVADPPEREVGASPSLEGGSQVQGACLEGKDVADPPVREVGIISSHEGEVQVQEVVKTGQARLMDLRKRMKRESQFIIRYMDNRKKAEVWKVEPFIPAGWTDWWRKVNLEEEKQLRKDLRVQQAGVAKEKYTERTIPNIALVGWRGWWNRMEAESKREEKEKKKKEATQKAQKAQEKMKPLELYFRKLKHKLEPSGMENNTGIFSSSENSSPKRKLPSSSSSIVKESPGKKQKLNFRENLSFWRTLEGVGGTHSQQGPANIAVWKISEQKAATQTNKQNNLEVVIWRDCPESETGLLSGGSPSAIYHQQSGDEASVSEQL